MTTLAINTSDNFVSIALLDQMAVIAEADSRVDFEPVGGSTSKHAGANDRLPAGYTQKRSKRGQATRRVFPPGASVMLAPMVQSLLKQQGITAQDLSLICVAIGPGMFTGLRVGVVTAKALAYATHAKLVAVNTLDATAAQNFRANAGLAERNLHVAVNAQRRQLFVNRFRAGKKSWEVDKIDEDRIVGQKEFVASVTENEVVSGPGLKLISDQLKTSRPELEVAPQPDWELSAPSVGRFGSRLYENGHESDLWAIEPLYFRPSAADEKRNQRPGGASLSN